MTLEERVQALAEFGFTERQTRFLVAVMLPARACRVNSRRSRASRTAIRSADSSTDSWPMDMRQHAAVCTIAPVSITCTIGRCIAPLASPKVHTADRFLRAGSSSA